MAATDGNRLARVREVVKNYRDNHIPLDSVILDIDYMEAYKDFTIKEVICEPINTYVVIEEKDSDKE